LCCVVPDRKVDVIWKPADDETDADNDNSFSVPFDSFGLNL